MMKGFPATSTVLAAAVSLQLLTGCDPLQKPEEPVTAPPPPPPPVVVAPPPKAEEPTPPPPQKTPDEIITEFLELAPYQRTDEKLVELASLEEGLDRITELNLTRAPVTEKGISAVAGLPKLKKLDLSYCRINNDDLKGLPECKMLEVLILENTRVDTGGMIYVGQVPTLRELNLAGTGLTDAGFVSIKDLPHLQILKISNIPTLFGREFGRLVDEGAFADLRELNANQTRLAIYGMDSSNRLSHLEVFRGEGSGVTDEVLKSLARCGQLRVLDLSNTEVTPEGIKQLKKLKNLEELSLRDCNAISNAALDSLKLKKNLKVLDLNHTACTLEAVRLLSNTFLKETDILYDNQIF